MLGPDVATGSLVLIREEHVPPAKWMMGRVVEVHRGKDGLVLVVSIRTRTGILKRPLEMDLEGHVTSQCLVGKQQIINYVSTCVIGTIGVSQASNSLRKLNSVENFTKKRSILLNDVSEEGGLTYGGLQVNGDVPPRVKKDAHTLILEFIRSRPPLSPVRTAQAAQPPIQHYGRLISFTSHPSNLSLASKRVEDPRELDIVEGNLMTQFGEDRQFPGKHTLPFTEITKDVCCLGPDLDLLGKCLGNPFLDPSEDF
ncbi:hypothetical protein LAZ67_3001244 [Cordylochernes scorpioides]|uniref:DUF5641 domain-containing protein n=1 Tax=Cordylochernes scorpioides TaxID=51811 RepID=A0ABY6K7R8_9ARAC|nr:hypothetical protein LAZ67_3001244 [Cordylochernes scorpioides]